MSSLLIPDVWTFVLAVGSDIMISFANTKTKKCLSLAIIALLAVSVCGIIALSDSTQASATDPLISDVTGTAGTDTLEVTIGATVVNATTITIDYGDESTAATVTATDDVISSTYTYATAGTYTVTITATDGTDGDVYDIATAIYVTSTGVWTNNYTVTFMGITTIEDIQQVAPGGFATIPALTSTTGTITWLADSADATTIFDFETTAITADITLYYHFIPTASTTDDGGILDDIVNGLTSIWNGIVSFFESIWNVIVSFFTDIWNGITKYI